MSASDLVPRVVLLVTDLERENAELKSQLKEQEEKQLLIQITGQNRTPIHFEGSMKNGFSPNNYHWYLQVDIVLPLLLFTNLELWLNGIFIENFRAINRLNFMGVRNDDDDDNDGTGSGWFQFRPEGVTTRGRRPVSTINVNIGPMTRDDYNKLSSTLDVEAQIASQNNISSGKITAIEFRKENIPGIISLLEKMGIDTSADDYIFDDSDGDEDNNDAREDDSDIDDDDDDATL